MNFPDNWYPFRQDSSFLYYWGHALPHLAGLIDTDEGRHILFADSPTVDHIIWSGPQPGAAALAEGVGATEVRPPAALEDTVRRLISSGRRVHFEPPYRQDAQAKLESLLHLGAGTAALHASGSLSRAVITQRSVKEAREIDEIESALSVSYDMHVAAMRLARPGRFEREIAATWKGSLSPAVAVWLFRASFPSAARSCTTIRTVISFRRVT